MQKRLPKLVFKSLIATIEHSKPLDPTVADVVAAAMKDWAMEKGATHYAHVFFPLTHLTAEKHDSFLEPGGDGSSIAEFSARRSRKASLTHRVSRAAVCGRPSRLVDIPVGTRPVRPTSWRTRTGGHCASRPCSFP